MPKTRLPVILVYVSILTTGEAVSREQGRLDRKMQGTNERRRRLDYWRTTSYELLGAWMNIFPFSLLLIKSISPSWVLSRCRLGLLWIGLDFSSILTLRSFKDIEQRRACMCDVYTRLDLKYAGE